MPISVRVSADLERRVAQAAKEMNITRSEIIVRSLEAYLGGLALQSPYELLQDLLPKLPPASNSKGDKARTYKERIREAVRAKHAR